MAKIWDAPVEEISDTYAAHRIGLSLSLKATKPAPTLRIFAMLGQAAEENAAWQETTRLMVQESKERENLIQDLRNQAVRSNTSEGVLAGVEGVSRGSGHVAENFASENERRTTKDLQEEISELQKPNPMRGLAGLSMRASRERIADIERVLKNREMGMASSVNRGTLRNGVQVAGDYLTAFADATARTRSNVDAAYPVTEEFRASLGAADKESGENDKGSVNSLMSVKFKISA